MIDLSNLYANMTHVCQQASLAELETMLRVIGNTLERRFERASLRCFQAAQELHDYRLGKRPRRNIHANEPGRPPCYDYDDEGGEA